MKRLLYATIGGATVALAAPAAGQMMDHSRHGPGMTMGKPIAKPRPPARGAATRPVSTQSRTRIVTRRSTPPAAAATACAPEHAAMGHCTAAKPEAARATGASGPTQAAGAVPSITPPTADTSCPAEHAAMGHCTPKGATQAPAPIDPACPPEHAAMGHCVPKPSAATGASPATGGGTASPAGNAPAPAAPEANYADRVWGRDAMEPARDILHNEHGGMTFSQLIFNLAELQVRNGRDGYRWDGELWYGGDIDRLTVKTEGEGAFQESAGGEVQALYSRAIGPYFNLQAGVRQDIATGPDRNYATLGFEGLAPYWFDVEGAMFLSSRGDVSGRLEGYYDQRITQRLILQPRVEVDLSIQDVPSLRLGSGITGAEAGLRLRYEIAREAAPYVGVSWERAFGDTARFARADGDGTGGFSLVAGIRTWF